MESDLRTEIEYEWDKYLQEWHVLVRIFYRDQQTHWYELKALTAAQMRLLDGDKCGV